MCDYITYLENKWNFFQIKIVKFSNKISLHTQILNNLIKNWFFNHQ